MGMIVATGGSIRCEIIQNAMSSLPTPRLKRRATVCSSNTKTPMPATTPSGHGPPAITTTTAMATAIAKDPIAPKPTW